MRKMRDVREVREVQDVQDVQEVQPCSAYHSTDSSQPMTFLPTWSIRLC